MGNVSDNIYLEANGNEESLGDGIMCGDAAVPVADRGDGRGA